MRPSRSIHHPAAAPSQSQGFFPSLTFFLFFGQSALSYPFYRKLKKIEKIHLLMAINDEYLRKAALVISAPNVLINMVSKRAKQLRLGAKPMVQSLERLSPENLALKEIAEGRLTYKLESETLADGETEIEVIPNPSTQHPEGTGPLAHSA